jgi:hypothetical protein
MVKKILLGSALAALLMVGWRGDFANAQQAPPAPAGSQPTAPGDQQPMADPEVLDKGPIHEAFAEPLTLDQQTLEIISKQPPQPVNELPPADQPEGRNVQWIPGYWMFDKGRDDFVWVSGMWRDVPPGRKWIPGEWQQVDNGFQWVPGFWADAKQEQVQVLPAPPESLEAGPSSPSPGENYLWAPGNWAYQNGQYVWQPGYWYEGNSNYVWVPNHYTYSPRGSMYVNGYWDYLPQNRGLLYAPVYWGRNYAGGYGGYYRPRSIINTGLLIANLFVNRGYGHYYYGNWGGNYPGWLQPWGYNYGQWGYRSGNRYGYDPMWAYFRWSNRNNWDNNWWNDRNNWNRDRDNWDRWSWDGRRGRDWDGRPGDRDRDRDGRPGDRDRDRDGRPGGPRDRDVVGDADGRGDGDRRNRDLVTTVDDLRGDGRNALSTRQLSEADINRARDRARNLNRTRRDAIVDTNVGAATNLEGQIRGEGSRRGQANLGAQLGVEGRGQVRGGGRDRNQIGSQPGIQGSGEAQVGDNGLGGRVQVDPNTQVRRGTGYRGEGRGRGQADVDLNNQNNIDRSVDGQARDQLRNQVDGSINQQFRGRTQGPRVDGRTYSRSQQGIQSGDRPRGQIQGSPQSPRNLEGPIPQRVMRLPSGQEVMPQGQNFRSRGEGQPQGSFNRGSGEGRPQGSFNRGGGEGRPSISIPQGGGGRQSFQGSGNRGGGGGQSFQGGGNRGGGGDAFRGGGGGGGGRGGGGGGEGGGGGRRGR